MGFLALSEIIPPGSVFPYAGASAPSGWLICDGSAVSRTTYAGLFAVLSTSHGSGDGSTTFNVPDYRGQFMRGIVPSALNSITGSGTASSNNATFTAHGLNRTGIKVQLLSGTLSGLATATTYYAIVVDVNTLAFATTRANAIAGTKIAITGANSAVITQYEDPDAGSRASITIGSNSSGLGSAQDHQITGHSHTISGTTGAQFPATVATAGGYNGTGGIFNGSSSTVLPYGNNVIKADSTTGNETRPQNVYVNYIVKV